MKRLRLATSAAPDSYSSRADARKFVRLRTLLAAGLLVGLLASVTAPSVGARSIVGPWTCGPDSTISFSAYVTGPSGSYVGFDFKYIDKYGGIRLWGTTVNPGTRTINLPSAGRSIVTFTYWEYNHSVLRAWGTGCS